MTMIMRAYYKIYVHKIGCKNTKKISCIQIFYSKSHKKLKFCARFTKIDTVQITKRQYLHMKLRKKNEELCQL